MSTLRGGVVREGIFYSLENAPLFGRKKLIFAVFQAISSSIPPFFSQNSTIAVPSLLLLPLTSRPPVVVSSLINGL